MQLINIVKSKVDSTVKYVFDLDGIPVEASYINKQDGKDIMCVPTQTSCKMGCKFCFLTGSNYPVKNLSRTQISAILETISEKSRLPQSKTLLISYMGSGEPLVNYANLIEASLEIKSIFNHRYETVRFAVASMVPNLTLMQSFTQEVKKAKLPIKFHFSLHSLNNTLRQEMMPSAAEVTSSLKSVISYMQETSNPAEIHYTLIDGINDSEQDLYDLVQALIQYPIPIKFLDFKAKPQESYQPSRKVQYFMDILRSKNIRAEFYNPPGSDIGSSCGQFLIN